MEFFCKAALLLKGSNRYWELFLVCCRQSGGQQETFLPSLAINASSMKKPYAFLIEVMLNYFSHLQP